VVHGEVLALPVEVVQVEVIDVASRSEIGLVAAVVEGREHHRTRLHAGQHTLDGVQVERPRRARRPCQSATLLHPRPGGGTSEQHLDVARFVEDE